MRKGTSPKHFRGVKLDYPHTKLGLCLNPVTYVSPSRTTYADVMCVTNTRKVNEPKKHGMLNPKMVPECILPYDVEMMLQSVDIYVKGVKTPLEIKKDAQMRNKKNKQLMKERQSFVGKLEYERSKRYQQEINACVKIQAYFRGFLMRRHGGRNEAMRKKSKKDKVPGEFFLKEISKELMEITSKTGLEPIQGYTLGKQVASRWDKKDMQIAMSKIQGLVRKFLYNIRNRDKKQTVYATVGRKLAELLTNLYLKRKSLFYKVTEILINKSAVATKIQKSFRGYRARSMTLLLRQKIEFIVQQKAACLKILRIFRKFQKTFKEKHGTNLGDASKRDTSYQGRKFVSPSLQRKGLRIMLLSYSPMRAFEEVKKKIERSRNSAFIEAQTMTKI